MSDLYEYSTPETVRLMGTRFKDYRMRCGLTQKKRIGAIWHRIDHHPQIRERSGGQPDTVDFHSPDESHRLDQQYGQPPAGTSRIAISDT